MRDLLTAEVERPVEDVKKSQAVRLYMDILFIGPYLIYLSRKGRVDSNDKMILTGIAVATIAYNARNLIKNG